MREQKYADNFKKLLDWLDADAEKAALEYESIRRVLIKIFLSNNCSNAEDLADAAFDRVASKVAALEADYTGNKKLYFAGVARKLVLESRRTKELLLGAEKFEIADEKAEKTYEFEKNEPAESSCLKKCLKKLETRRKNLILAYFSDTNIRKSEHHRRIAEKYSMSANALRIRIFKDKKTLLDCCRDCMKGEE